eukprot:2943864-Prymnesium_polylepis.1
MPPPSWLRCQMYRLPGAVWPLKNLAGRRETEADKRVRGMAVAACCAHDGAVPMLAQQLHTLPNPAWVRRL